MKRPFYIYIGEAADESEAEELLSELAGCNDGSEIMANATPIFFDEFKKEST